TNPKEELTKSFINSVLQFELPDHLLQKRTGTMVKIHFKGETAEEAIVSDMLQTFKVKGNILHGKIEYIQEIPLGIFVMELTGEPEEIERAINYISQRTNALEVIAHAA
ncbi:NIL domain-containing protein, partial [Saccharococcus caldoxylosilyticus]